MATRHHHSGSLHQPTLSYQVFPLTDLITNEMRVPDLRPAQIHLWNLRLAGSKRLLAYMESLLSADELERAYRFRPLDKRTRFILARGWVRRLLGKYLDVAPDQVQFDYGPYGKPTINMSAVDVDIRFNLSHSRDLGILAIAARLELGVDIEFIDPATPVNDIANRFFSPYEAEAISILPQQSRREGFFLCWTRKEAFIKARGEGLSYPLQEFDVSVEPQEPARIIATRTDVAEAQRWTLYNLDIHPQYRAALVVAGSGHQLCPYEVTAF